MKRKKRFFFFKKPKKKSILHIIGLDSLSLSPSFQQKSSIKSSVSSSASSTTDDQDDDEPNDEIVKQRVVAIVSTLLDDLDNENVPKKQYCQQLEEAVNHLCFILNNKKNKMF